jgi:hypothetical protein
VKSPKNTLIALLAIIAIGAGWVAWRQSAEMAELRTAAMKKDERADLQKRVWDLEKLNRELRAQLTGQRGDGGEVATADRPPREFGGPGGRGPRMEGMGPQFGAMRDLMMKPEVQAMMNLQQQADIDRRYAALFKNLNLQPEQVDRLKALLAERSTAIMDVMAAARDQGIDPRQNPDAVRKLVADAENEINNSIKSTIGETGFAQLTSYEQTMPQRAVVNQLEQRLSYTNTPLTSAQAEQLVQILASNPAQQPATSAGAGPAGPQPGRGPDFGGMVVGMFGPGAAPMVGMMEAGRGGGAATVTPAAVTQAQTILSPPQTQALQQIQQQQQSQQQLRQIVNETLSANPPPSPPGSNPQPARKRPGG